MGDDDWNCGGCWGTVCKDTQPHSPSTLESASVPQPDHTLPQRPTAEVRYSTELAALADMKGPRPPGWSLTPRAVVEFICGGHSPKFVGDRSLVERCVVTLAGARGLLLVGEPGTAKSLLSELLAAAICGTSELTVQGSAGTTEDQLRYGWNYGMLLAEGPSEKALVPSPVMTAMRTGRVARIEEITRCLPEVQDAVVPVLSERRMSVPELGMHSVEASPGFCVIGTANLRDKGVSEMSAALKRRFSFESVATIADRDREIELVNRQTQDALVGAGVPHPVDEPLVHALVTVMRDLRHGITEEGWAVERPSTVMSTAETVAISQSLALASTFFPPDAGAASLIPGYLLGAVLKDDERDASRLHAYWDSAVRRRGSDGGNSALWRTLWDHRAELQT